MLRRACVRAVSPELSLFAHMKYRSRPSVRPKIRHLAPLDGCTCLSHDMAQLQFPSMCLIYIGDDIGTHCLQNISSSWLLDCDRLLGSGWLFGCISLLGSGVLRGSGSLLVSGWLLDCSSLHDSRSLLGSGWSHC